MGRLRETERRKREKYRESIIGRKRYRERVGGIEMQG